MLYLIHYKIDILKSFAEKDIKTVIRKYINGGYHMTREEFKTIMEMVRMIVEGSKDKEDALKKIDSLTILKGEPKKGE